MLLNLTGLASLYFVYVELKYDLIGFSNGLSFLSSIFIFFCWIFFLYCLIVFLLTISTSKKLRTSIYIDDVYLCIPNVNAYAKLLLFEPKIFKFKLDSSLVVEIVKNVKRGPLNLDILYISDDKSRAELYDSMLNEGNIKSLEEDISKEIK